ncbi:TRAP transporter substrate-binding protein [uncultured Agathobaculum sp.]|uniref:TRAP transporter substrate-binding protein n=1 Tax=uncultured Agathobaculum sp. TaxID=2048140 RepID=UPI00296F7447
MKRMKKILACVLAGAALLTATGCSGSQDPKRLLVAHGHGDWHPVHIGLSYLCDEMEKETDYTFDIYPNGQLGDDSAMVQLVKAGVLDIAKVSAGALEQFNPAYSIFSIPYVFQSTEHYFNVMNNSEAVQEIFESTRKDGFIAIGWFDSGSRSIYTTKDGPAATPADLKGLKIRTMNSPTSVSMINAMGAAATPMSSGEVYTSLQQGIIDGAENNETVLVDDGHGEVAKSYTYTQHQYLPDIVIISTETWDGMTEEEQNDLREAMKGAWQAHETEWNKIVERNKTGAKEMGVQFYEIDKTAFIEACKPLQDEFCAKSEDNARYFADFQSYLDK